jgi:hypothetical protein
MQPADHRRAPRRRPVARFRARAAEGAGGYISATSFWRASIMAPSLSINGHRSGTALAFAGFALFAVLRLVLGMERSLARGVESNNQFR